MTGLRENGLPNGKLFQKQGDLWIGFAASLSAGQPEASCFSLYQLTGVPIKFAVYSTS